MHHSLVPELLLALVTPKSAYNPNGAPHGRDNLLAIGGVATAMKTIVAAIALLTVLGGCSTQRSIRRPNGDLEYLIKCDATGGWKACYDQADKLCPTGYKPLSEDAGSGGKELRVTCPEVTK